MSCVMEVKYILAVLCIIYLFLIATNGNTEFDNDTTRQELSKEERNHLREEAREMFYHGYNSYMDNAYPADELMPLSCKGRWRDSEHSRGDIDDALGNFSLTLIDALDTLVIIGDLEEFEHALKLIIRDVSFDQNIIVSLFETNIRVVGGLISGHILADHINQLYGVVSWYRGELLSMAQDLATRLLPAFNTSTGIPHPRVNLRHGMKSPKLHNSRDTCTACAGTIILEFASLSRLTGEPVFEEKARQALDYLWAQRHRGSDLVGTVLNIHSGDWIRRDSGVGAGIDSYYEYLLKAYVLLGDEAYLDRFNKHYNAVMKYVSQGPMLLDVHMHRPHTTSRNFMDALLAFWPGLQVLKGDIKPAIETHEMLYQVIQRHNFLPEAFTTDFQVHWGQHPLRPEFVESTYLLFQATGDHYYLRVGERVLRSLQKHAWVACGYAAVKDVRTGVHEDRMDSFVLAETFKYLYLLFAEPSDLNINLDEFIFTTEAHLLPLSLARLSNLTTVPLADHQSDISEDMDVEYARSCPNAHYLFPGRHKFAETIRKPLKNFVNNICPTRKSLKRKLRASEFQVGSSNHVNLLRDMGITIMSMQDGRVQLLHTSSNAKTSTDAEEGLLFMQEMIELSKLQQEQPENPPRAVTFMQLADPENIPVSIIAGPAQFGMELKGGAIVTAPVVIAEPLKACGSLDNKDNIQGKIVIMERGECMFIEKARTIEALGATGGIVLDYTQGSSSKTSPMFAMSGDGTDDVSIPMVFLFRGDAQVLLDALDEDPHIQAVLSDYAASELPKSDLNTSDGMQQATGPTVKATLKKYQISQEGPICSSEPHKGIIEEVVDMEDEDLNAHMAREAIQNAQTDQEVHRAVLNYFNNKQKRNVIKDDPSSTSFHLAALTELQKLISSEVDTLNPQSKELFGESNEASPVKEAIENYLNILISKLNFENGSPQTSGGVSESAEIVPSESSDDLIAPKGTYEETMLFLTDSVENFVHNLNKELFNDEKDSESSSKLVSLFSSLLKNRITTLKQHYEGLNTNTPPPSTASRKDEL